MAYMPNLHLHIAIHLLLIHVHGLRTPNEGIDKKESEIVGQCGRQNILWLYLKIWDWDLLFGRAVKTISSPGVPSPCVHI